MSGLRKIIFPKKAVYFAVIGFILLLVLAATLILSNSFKGHNAVPAVFPRAYFEGEYRIGDGEWFEIVKGKHIPATKGDVTLRGTFHLTLQDGKYIGQAKNGVPIAFYMDHIGITVYDGKNEPYEMDNENPMYGVSGCAEDWGAYVLSDAENGPIELVIHNPHHFGNEMAVDDFLSKLSVWGGVDFNMDIIARGNFQKTTGTVFVIIAFVILGTALFSTLLHIKSNKTIWLGGLAVLFAGMYFLSSSVVNTTVNCLSLILYMLCASSLAVCSLDKAKWVGLLAVALLGVFDAVILIIPIFANIPIYDMLFVWMIVQNVINIFLLVALVFDAVLAKYAKGLARLGFTALFGAFALDSIATYMGFWKGGIASSFVFVLMLAVVLIFILQVIPKSINATVKAKILESEKKALNAELAESRVSMMISQIRPHFIYNTLGSIEQLCEEDPKLAGELVHNFAKYLRGNFGELDNPKPILMSNEMEHVRYYISIERLRFPDMSFVFNIRSNDFEIPALTVQPLVENAIKHGLMKLSEGGTVKVESFETETHYYITVEDNGVGFNSENPIDERKHIGIRNIRARLAAMVNGTLEIESRINEGTKVTVKIPKEGKI